MLNLSTKIKSEFWYSVPNVGTHTTKHWYGYKAFVRTLQSICTHRQDTFLCMKLKQ